MTRKSVTLNDEELLLAAKRLAEARRARLEAREPKSLAPLLKGAAKRLGLKKTGLLAEIRPVWAEVVPEALRAAARLSHCKNGVLTVEVTGVALKAEFEQFHRQPLLESLNRLLPAKARLRDLRFRLAPA